jgi:hypothetical protein
MAMTDPEGTQQDAELGPESSTDEASTGVNQKPEDEATADVTEEGATADYQARLSEFDNVESPVPVVEGTPDHSSQRTEFHNPGGSDFEVRRRHRVVEAADGDDACLVLRKWVFDRQTLP